MDFRDISSSVRSSVWRNKDTRYSIITNKTNHRDYGDILLILSAMTLLSRKPSTS
jgi:hypothetical protein